MSLGSRSLPARTAEEKRREDACKRAGCIACWLDGRGWCGPVEYHHFKLGNVRAGHRFGVALGLGHHQGRLVSGAELKGPSLAKSPREFREIYGGSDQALQDIQDRRIGWPTERIVRAKVPGCGKRSGRTGQRNGESARTPRKCRIGIDSFGR